MHCDFVLTLYKLLVKTKRNKKKKKKCAKAVFHPVTTFALALTNLTMWIDMWVVKFDFQR